MDSVRSHQTLKIPLRKAFGQDATPTNVHQLQIKEIRKIASKETKENNLTSFLIVLFFVCSNIDIIN